MLSKRIIPCLDVDRGRVVKGVSFIDIQDAGDPAELANYYNSEGADELVFLDITASSEKRKTMIEVVEKVSSEVFIPLTVGGGVSSTKDMGNMLNAGADKVAINSAAITNPKLIQNCSKYFGSQCVVVAIDAKKTNIGWKVYSHGGKIETNKDALNWAKEAYNLGAGELLVTSMDRDGTQKGYDIDLMQKISETVNIPVIASGGVGNLDHLAEGITKGKANAVLAASIFHYGKYSIKQAKEYLDSKGIPVRI